MAEAAPGRRGNRWREKGTTPEATRATSSPSCVTTRTQDFKAETGRKRNYDPANYVGPIPKSQEFIFGTEKWKAPIVPRGFEISGGLKLGSYLTDGTFGRCFTVTVVPGASEWERVAAGGLIAKIMRPVAKHNQYIGDAEIEAGYLSKLMASEACPASIVAFHGSVVFPDPLNAEKRYHALIFEACAASMHAFWQDYAQRRRWHPDDICSVAFQLLQCCAFLHGLGFTHTDIKHKNVMMKSGAMRPDCLRPVDASIKVIDFGNMTHAEDYHTQPIGTRQFRAPEIQLGLDWDEKFDLWGCGCVLHWMHEARTVFEPYSEAEQLDLMETLVGKRLPKKLVARSAKQHLFDETGELKRVRGKDGGAKGGGKKGGGKKGGGKGKSANIAPISEGVEELGLQRLLLDLLELDPSDRVPAQTLLIKYESYFKGAS